MEKQKIEVGFAPKTVKLENGWLHFWYANNRGRGDNNVTVILAATETRAPLSRNQTDVVRSTLTSAWRGKVNFSHAVQVQLGLA